MYIKRMVYFHAPGTLQLKIKDRRLSRTTKETEENWYFTEHKMSS